MRYELTTEAQNDLTEIVNYLIDEAGTDVAAKVITNIRDTFRDLAATPSLGHFREDLLDQRHKFFKVYSYLIVYRQQQNTLQILAIVHGARNLQALFLRRFTS